MSKKSTSTRNYKNRNYKHHPYTQASISDLKQFLLNDTKVEIESLTDRDVGRWVEYKSTERGRIKGWNNQFVFVVYKCNNNWNCYQDYTGVATPVEDLHFLYDKNEY